MVPLAAVAAWRIYLARATISRVLPPGFQTHRELLGCLQSRVSCLCQGRRMQFRCVLVLRRRLTWVSQLTAGFHNKATRRASAMKVRGGKRGPAQLGGISVPLAAVAEWRIYRARATISMGAISGVPDSPGASQMFCRVGLLAYARGAGCSFGVCWC